ncbi:MAG: cadherin-like beta sandwich domain-containing protein, partial [Nitrospira sp.]|nr:cadherin-like beta sandwich domain-containing protein [Nitrospira sp.]
MKHIFTSVAQAHLATVLLVTISVGAYGCADSATVNPAVELASLTVTPGTVQPTFTGSTTQYSVDLTSNITSVTVSAQPAVQVDSVTINGLATTSRVITLGPAGSTTPVSIVVSESGSNSRTYTVLLNRAGLAGNNSLLSLSVSPGTLAPTF